MRGPAGQIHALTEGFAEVSATNKTKTNICPPRHKVVDVRAGRRRRLNGLDTEGDDCCGTLCPWGG